MRVQEKKRQRIYDLLNTETKPKKFPKQLKFLYGLHWAQTITPWSHYMGRFRKQNKTAIEEEWNKMSEEFILKACWYHNWKKKTQKASNTG